RRTNSSRACRWARSNERRTRTDPCPAHLCAVRRHRRAVDARTGRRRRSAVAHPPPAEGDRMTSNEWEDQLSLNAQNLPALSERGISVPGYDRSAVAPGIVHFGVGGFHRARVAMVVDELVRAGAAGDWAIVGGGVRAHDAGMRDALGAQDHLYTLTLKPPDGAKERRVIGSIIDYRFGPDDPQGLLDLLTDPA